MQIFLFFIPFTNNLNKMVYNIRKKCFSLYKDVSLWILWDALTLLINYKHVHELALIIYVILVVLTKQVCFLHRG